MDSTCPQICLDVVPEWDLIEHDWQEKYEQLKQYIQENGDANVPQRHSALGKWVRSQRERKGLGKLSNERIKLLDEIGFIWNPPIGPRKTTK